MIARALLFVASSLLVACGKAPTPPETPQLSAQPSPPPATSASGGHVGTEKVEPDKGPQQSAPALTQDERERLIRRTEIADPKSEPGK